MVHAYHAIFSAYGFWLPNDPRGSWSDFVGAWELLRFGHSTKSLSRRILSEYEEHLRQAAKTALKYPPVHFSDVQREVISQGFAEAIEASNLTVWACSILPEHVHMVISRHVYEVEKIVNQMKGKATKHLRKKKLDPLDAFTEKGKRPPSPWARGEWKVFLDTQCSIDQAIQYVDDNPEKEGMPAQHWSFVQPFRGLETGWTTYH